MNPSEDILGFVVLSQAKMNQERDEGMCHFKLRRSILFLKYIFW